MGAVLDAVREIAHGLRDAPGVARVDEGGPTADYDYGVDVVPENPDAAPLSAVVDVDAVTVTVGDDIRFEHFFTPGKDEDAVVEFVRAVFAAVLAGEVEEVYLGRRRRVSTYGRVGRHTSGTLLAPVGRLIGTRRRYAAYREPRGSGRE